MSQLIDPRVIELIRVYQQARKNLLAIIFKSETSGSIASYQRALLRQVEEELSSLDISCQKWTQETLEGFYMEGVDNVDTYLKEHDLPITGSFAKLHTEAINSIVENTLYDLSIANKHVGRKIRDDIRDICLDVIGQKIATGKSVEQAKSMLMDRLLSDGIAYIKDGQKQIQLTKTWQLDKYAEMVARSTTREATNRGTLNQLEALGYDLVQVSEHNSPCPLCAQYEGRVYSILGDDKRFPPLDDMFDGEFCNIHPNCFVDAQIPIYTSKGWVAIGKIKIDDLVLTHRGRFRKVTFLHRNIGRKRIVKIQVNNLKSTRNANLTITESHPILINNEWVNSENVKIGDNIKVLAKYCETCGKPTPLFKKHCNKECEKFATNTKRDTPEWRKKLSKSSKKTMKERYANGLIDTKKTTEKAHEATRQMVINGNHPFQKPENHIKAQKSLGSKNHGKTWIEEKMGWYLTSVLGLNIESQFPIPKNIDIMGRQRYYYGDFFIKDKNIIIECDGSVWHKDIKKDKERQDFIESLGYTVLRFTDTEINTNLVNCGKEIMRVLANHNHEYLFMDLKVTKVEIHEPKRTYSLFNLAVEDDESYIAKGFVVHNCQHVVTPYVEEFAKDVNADILKSNTEMTEQELKNKTAGYYEQQKENREINRDRNQYEKYKLILGDKVGSFSDFRETKQDNPEAYDLLKSDYREKKSSLTKYE